MGIFRNNKSLSGRERKDIEEHKRLAWIHMQDILHKREPNYTVVHVPTGLVPQLYKQTVSLNIIDGKFAYYKLLFHTLNDALEGELSIDYVAGAMGAIFNNRFNPGTRLLQFEQASETD